MNDRERIENKLLVLRCQAGEPEAMTELVDRWKDRFWRHALRLCDGDGDTAWDLVQEAFLEISTKIMQLREAAAFPVWAYRIITNKAFRWQQREVRRREAMEDYQKEVFDSHPVMSAPETGNEPVAKLRRAIKKLERKDRAILGMYYEEEFSTGQIATILDIPAGTVKSRLFNARERLKKLIEEHENE